jgi:hypothetical protein
MAVIRPREEECTGNRTVKIGMKPPFTSDSRGLTENVVSRFGEVDL